uniref:Uncharacterized protein n=1 Tax=uncultured organism TaxID=155900 RepID=A0A0G2YLD0_9ZZZZ|nr:hypothetical protein [uncultured organism]
MHGASRAGTPVTAVELRQSLRRLAAGRQGQGGTRWRAS